MTMPPQLHHEECKADALVLAADLSTHSMGAAHVVFIDPGSLPDEAHHDMPGIRWGVAAETDVAAVQAEGWTPVYHVKTS